MARLRLLFMGSFGVLLATMPSSAFAVGFFGPIIPQSGSCFCNGGPLDWGCVIQVLQKLIELAVSLGVVLCVLWIAYAGFSLMLSAGNPDAISQGKIRVVNAVVGILVILCSWVIVDFVMKAIYNPSAVFSGSAIGPWHSILGGQGGDTFCIRQTTPMPLTTGQIVAGQSLVTSNGTGGLTGNGTVLLSGSGGSCAILPSGACSVAVLQNTCFGSRAQEAARICNLESAGGNPSSVSGSDRLADGSPYSVGLWQINLTTTPGLSVGGRDCRDAFTGNRSGCMRSNLIGRTGHCRLSVRDEGLYHQCVALAQNPQVNTERACYLYGPAHQGFGAWATSANRCGVSH